MPIYSRKITTDASSEKETTIEIEGDYITYVRIRFPPGPTGLLKVAFFYGIKQIFPWEEGTWFYGDDEIIEWPEFWKMPERKINLKIKTVNDDDTYSHDVYVVLVTMYKHQLVFTQLVSSIVSAIKRLFGFV